VVLGTRLVLNPRTSYLMPLSIHSPRLLRLMVTVRFWKQSLAFDGPVSKVSHGITSVEVRLFRVLERQVVALADCHQRKNG
jgi:hypothetical protein